MANHFLNIHEAKFVREREREREISEHERNNANIVIPSYFDSDRSICFPESRYSLFFTIIIHLSDNTSSPHFR